MAQLVTTERKVLIDELVAQEDRLEGMLVSLRDALAEANKLVSSVGSLASKYVPERTEAVFAADAAPRKPFDILDYQQTVAQVAGTIQEAQALVVSVEHLLTSSGWTERVPELINTVDRVEQKGEELISHTFQLAVFLVLIAMAVLFCLALYLVRYSTNRMPRLRHEREHVG